MTMKNVFSVMGMGMSVLLAGCEVGQLNMDDFLDLDLTVEDECDDGWCDVSTDIVDTEYDMCAYTCSDHCVSIGGDEMPGFCPEGQKCCSWDIETDVVEDECQYTCSDVCFSVGGMVMPGACPDETQKCCDMDFFEDTDDEPDDEVCEYNCQAHCFSLGGHIMPGVCEGDLKCCNMDIDVII